MDDISRAGKFIDVVPEIVQAETDLSSQPVSSLDLLLREPSQIRLLNLIVADRRAGIASLDGAAPFCLVEQSNANVIEATLKAGEGFQGQTKF